jgi:hypothetical protein
MVEKIKLICKAYVFPSDLAAPQASVQAQPQPAPPSAAGAQPPFVDAALALFMQAAQAVPLAASSAVSPAHQKFVEIMPFLDGATNFDVEFRKWYLDVRVNILKGDIPPSSYVNPLAWFQSMAPEYPIMTSIARSVLCKMATSSEVERAFSAAGHIVTKLRNRLASRTVEDLMLGRAWLLRDPNVMQFMKTASALPSLQASTSAAQRGEEEPTTLEALALSSEAIDSMAAFKEAAEVAQFLAEKGAISAYYDGCVVSGDDDPVTAAGGGAMAWHTGAAGGGGGGSSSGSGGNSSLLGGAGAAASYGAGAGYKRGAGEHEVDVGDAGFLSKKRK